MIQAVSKKAGIGISGGIERDKMLDFESFFGIREGIMYTEKAIIRMNHIDWNHIGEEGRAEDMELGIDFIKKMANFCSQNNITPTLPFMTDLASFFTDYEIGKDILEQCSYDVRKIIENPAFSTIIISFYIKAAVLAEKDAKYAVCMEVYDPIIRLFEKGGNFCYRERGMSFIGSGLIPLPENWVEKFSV